MTQDADWAASPPPRDPERDGRVARALRLRIACLKAERKVLAQLWLRLEQRHRREQLALLDEIDGLTEWLQRFRSLVHRLEFTPDGDERAAA